MTDSVKTNDIPPTSSVYVELVQMLQLNISSFQEIDVDSITSTISKLSLTLEELKGIRGIILLWYKDAPNENITRLYLKLKQNIDRMISEMRLTWVSDEVRQKVHKLETEANKNRFTLALKKDLPPKMLEVYKFFCEIMKYSETTWEAVKRLDNLLYQATRELIKTWYRAINMDKLSKFKNELNNFAGDIKWTKQTSELIGFFDEFIMFVCDKKKTEKTS